MLIWMREGKGSKVVKYTLMSFLLLAVCGLVLMDVGGFFKTQMGSNTVVKGGGVEIGISEFDRTVRRTLSQQGMGPQEAFQLGMINQILASEIQSRLFTDKSRDLGLEVSDSDVTRQIGKLAEPLATDGRTKKEALQQILRTQGISEGEFVNSIREEMGNTLLRAAIMPPATLASPMMAEELYRYDNEKRDAKIIVLKDDGITDAKEATEEQLSKFYESNKQDYMIPGTRTVTMATLKPDMLKKNIKISDEQLKAEYDKNLASFTKPARRSVEQVVLQSEDDAKKALEEMKAGKSPKDAMTQEYEQAGLLPEIATPVFEAKKGAVVGPIKTDLGWHILKVKDLLPESVTPFASMKDRLRNELENIALTDELYQAGNTIEDRIAAGDKFEDIVKEYGMTTEALGPFRQNGFDKDGKDLFKPYAADRDKMIQATYDYEQGEITPVVETADGQFRMFRIDTVTPDTYKDYASVKGNLQQRWIAEQQRLANKDRAKKALEELNAGKSVDQVASANNATVQTVTGVNRKTAPAAPLTPVVAAQIFSVSKGKNFSAEIENGYILGQVESVSLPPATQKPDAKELADLEDLTGRSLGQDLLGAYVAGLTDAKKIRINQQRLEQVYGKPQDVQ